MKREWLYDLKNIFFPVLLMEILLSNVHIMIWGTKIFVAMKFMNTIKKQEESGVMTRTVNAEIL